MDGTENAQTQLQGIHAMQGALAQIMAHGGTTGLGAEQIKNLQSAINTGAGVLGLGQQFDISDPEFLGKFNRQIAGAQAKAVGGARVTNFELQNYLSANPGLSMSPTGNQRLLGIQAQIAERSVALGQALRANTAAAITKGAQPDAGANESLITQYDAQHPIVDPISGQDLTKNVRIPELQSAGPTPSAVASPASASATAAPAEASPRASGPRAPIPDEAIAELRQNPSPKMQLHFDAAFGQGAAIKELMRQ